MLTLTLLVFAGQVSAQLSLSLSEGGSTTVSGAGTEISVDVFQMGVTASVNAIQIVFDVDTDVVTLTGAPAGFIISGGNTATVLSVTPVPMPASASFTFTTAKDVTGVEFSIGISGISLDNVPLPVPLPAAILFNSPSLHLDTQIESPAQNNSVLTLSEKKPGDTIQFQLFAPNVAGYGFNAIQFELSLQGKRLSSYISSNVSGGWISQVSGSGNLSLTRLSVTPVSVPSSGYLGQIDLEVTGALTSDDMLMVAQAILDNRRLDVSGAVLSFAQAQCPGDFDKNGMVDVTDFLAFVKVFGTSSGDATFNALMDMDGNGAVGIPDFLAFVKVFGTTCGTTSLPPPPPPPPGDRAALVALYNATNGDNWTNNTNWLSDRPIGEWHGVTTNANGRVTELRFSRNQLSGELPESLGDLRNLQSLSVYDNDLSGELPSSLGNLTNLQSLGLGENDFSGPLPSSLGNLTNLESLTLDDNQLSGALPSSLGNLTNLRLLYLDNTQLCAPPDAAFQTWLQGIENKRGVVNCGIGGGGQPNPDRDALVALYNATNGDNWTNNTNWLSDRPLGEWFGVTTNANGRVVDLYMPGNQLRGQIPSALGNLSKLTRLHLYNNQLSGAIPSELGQLTNLTSKLDLGNNQLSGAIPSELRQLTNLTNLRLSNNRLNGPIPTWIGSLSNLTWLSLGGNPWSGSVPAELGNLSKLESLELRSMRLSGAIPTWIGNLSNLKFLGLYDNQLSGAIPTWIGNLSNLEILELSSNTALSGELPTSLVDLTNLQQLHLDGTQLCAPTDAVFQAWLQGIENKVGVVNCGSGGGGQPNPDRDALIALYNATNGDNWTNDTNWLSDKPLGEWFGVTTDENGRVTRLQLRENDLSGELPAELGDLANLQWLGFSVNALSGTIPSSLGNLAQLRVLVLDANALSGTIPSSLGNLTNLELLYLDGNALSGSLPSSLGNLTELYTLHLQNNALSGTIPSSLGNLTRLVHLALSDNRLSGELPSSFGNLTNLQSLDLRNTQLCAPTDAAFQAWLQGIENKRGVVDCGSGSGSTLVSIPDANLRAVVEDSLGKARGAPITQAEMATLTRLEAPNSNISDLTGLEFAIRLSYLTLGRVYVGGEDNVNRNEISDLSPLSNLTRLTNLNLANNDISDLSPLSNLTNLTRLDLALNGGISDLSPLSNLTNLTALGLESNSIEVLSPLSNLTRLTDLRLARNYISDLSPLSNLTRLTRLNLVLNGSIRDLSPLSNLTRLTDLDLIENSISDLSPLVANTGLGRGDKVDVRNNPLSATSRNTHIPALQGRGVEVLFGALPTAGKPAVIDEQEPRMGSVLPEDRGYNSLRR